MMSIEATAMALSEPIRLRILDLTASGRTGACCSPADASDPSGICACDIGPSLGLTPSKLAYHLRILRDADLVSERRVGKWVYYTLNESAVVAFCVALSARYAPQSDAGPEGEPVLPSGGACGKASESCGPANRTV
jgi:ArsR family transcriptional regulator